MKLRSLRLISLIALLCAAGSQAWGMGAEALKAGKGAPKTKAMGYTKKVVAPKEVYTGTEKGGALEEIGGLKPSVKERIKLFGAQEKLEKDIERGPGWRKQLYEPGKKTTDVLGTKFTKKPIDTTKKIKEDGDTSTTKIDIKAEKERIEKERELKLQLETAQKKRVGEVAVVKTKAERAAELEAAKAAAKKTYVVEEVEKPKSLVAVLSGKAEVQRMGETQISDVIKILPDADPSNVNKLINEIEKIPDPEVKQEKIKELEAKVMSLQKEQGTAGQVAGKNAQALQAVRAAGEEAKFGAMSKEGQFAELKRGLNFVHGDATLTPKSVKAFHKDMLRAAKDSFGEDSDEYKAIKKQIDDKNKELEKQQPSFVKRHKKKLMVAGAIGLGIALLGAGIGIGYAIGSANDEEIKQEINIREETVINIDADIKNAEETGDPNNELDDLKDEKERLEEELAILREELADRDKTNKELEEQKAELEADDQSRAEALKQLQALFDQIITEEGVDVEGEVESVYRQDIKADVTR